MSAQNIRGGPNVLVNKYGDNYVVSARQNKQYFQSAFLPSWNGVDVFIGYGTVNGVEPTINGIPISGLPNKPRPSVKIENYDTEGRSWIAIRVQVSAPKYKILTADQVTIVNVTTAGDSKLESENPLIGLIPIAVASNTGIHQIVHFNLNHAVGVPPLGIKTPRHFFW